MFENTIKIKGTLNFESLWMRFKDKMGVDYVLAHIDMLIDHDKEEYMNMPIHIEKKEFQDMLLKNTAFNREEFEVVGRIECLKEDTMKNYSYHKKCCIVVDQENHYLKHIPGVNKNVSLWA